MRQISENIKVIDLEELFAVRKIRFEAHLLKHFANVEQLSVEAIGNKLKDLINQSGRMYDLAVTIENYVNESKRYLQGLPDSLTLAFSMITLYKDEQQSDISEQFHNDKIDNMLKDGLLYSVIRDEVINFILRFPADFRTLTEAVVHLNAILSSDNKSEDTND